MYVVNYKLVSKFFIKHVWTLTTWEASVIYHKTIVSISIMINYSNLRCELKPNEFIKLIWNKLSLLIINEKIVNTLCTWGFVENVTDVYKGTY